ncbi:HD domain-containing protein [Kribbella sp. NPDC059898]|uniref:HD domain-containing protein n=1 Tax=Kribbella sp. NPDC059898 TaxID=3346995 RepID=UPI0036635D14
MRQLPDEATELLHQLKAPRRLMAHLRLVHDVACELTDWLDETYPAITFDATAVRFGAATHDIGKVRHPEELFAPGHLHEAAGEQLLLDAGVPPDLARFAGSHGTWGGESPLEHLLVSLADKVWKAKRVPDLEQLVVERIGGEPWEVFLRLDDLLDGLAAGADERLAFQNR